MLISRSFWPSMAMRSASVSRSHQERSWGRSCSHWSVNGSPLVEGGASRLGGGGCAAMGDPPAADLRISWVRSGRGRGPEVPDERCVCRIVYRQEGEITRRINTFPSCERGVLSEDRPPSRLGGEPMELRKGAMWTRGEAAVLHSCLGREGPSPTAIPRESGRRCQAETGRRALATSAWRLQGPTCGRGYAPATPLCAGWRESASYIAVSSEPSRVPAVWPPGRWQPAPPP